MHTLRTISEGLNSALPKMSQLVTKNNLPVTNPFSSIDTYFDLTEPAALEKNSKIDFALNVPLVNENSTFYIFPIPELDIHI